MKKYKLLFYILVILLIFIIYHYVNDDKINYVALGDNIANGENPYGSIDYSYTDYLADYLRDNNILREYLNEFVENNMNTDRLILEVLNDKQIAKKNKKYNLKQELRDSDLVTISVGQKEINDNIKIYNINNSLLDLNKIEKLLREIRKYAKNKIIFIGYYNPYLNNDYESMKVGEIIRVINSKVKNICSKNDIVFIDIYTEISYKKGFFPNPNSMNMNIFGQKKIYEKIRKITKII